MKSAKSADNSDKLLIANLSNGGFQLEEIPANSSIENHPIEGHVPIVAAHGQGGQEYISPRVQRFVVALIAGAAIGIGLELVLAIRYWNHKPIAI